MDRSGPDCPRKKINKEGEGKQIQNVRTEKSAGDKRILHGAELYEEKFDQCIRSTSPHPTSTLMPGPSDVDGAANDRQPVPRTRYLPYLM